LNNITGTWSPALNNTATTTYTFTPAAGQCATATNLTVTVSAAIIPVFNAVGPLCVNAAPPMLPSTSNNGINGTWNPAVISTSTAGTTNYIFTPANGQCAGTTQLTITVQPVSTLKITNPPVVCVPTTVDLTSPVITNGSGPGLSYTYWTDAAATIALSNPATITAGGTYYIKATPSGSCSVAQTEPVVVVIRQEIASIRYPTLTVLPAVNLPLNARDLGANYTYSWMPAIGLNAYNVRTPVFNHNQTTEYLVKIDAGGGCVLRDTLLIKVTEPTSLDCDIFVPKAWSPNGDGHNDKLIPLSVCITELKYFRIFNRWGKLMFETNRMGTGWDGTFRGQPQVLDTYTWTMRAVGVDGRDIHRAGNALLLR
jgi:gliding motility-associated-like protein